MPNDLSSDLVEKLLAYDSPTIANAVEGFKVRPRREGYMGPQMQCRFPDLGRVVGYATTCTIVEYDKEHPPDPEERLKWLESILDSPKPCVCVVQDKLHRKGWASHWGEMVGTRVKTLGASAIITDGAVRDMEALHDMGMKVWSEHVVVSHGFIDVGLANVPIDVAGLTVHPGDILHADCNGVVSIPHEVLDQMPKACEDLFEQERESLKKMAADGTDREKLRHRLRTKIKH
jgi:regulator of RNase E activity RraA